ncbi:MAG: FIST C-terminal domain-containing protein [Actinomycetota bacterium]|nr:FIST C-terminal domain-containing protein [Actinomycetota bacterium]
MSPPANVSRVTVGAGLATHGDPRLGAIEAAAAAAAGLAGPPDLAVVFASGAHVATPEVTLEAIQEILGASTLIGCGAGGVLGGGRELEGGTAVAVWAASFGDGGTVVPFHATAEPDGDELAIDDLPELAGASGVIMLPDPYSFPTDLVLAELARSAPGVPVLGGLSSARTLDGEAALFLGEEVHERGVVGVRLEDVDFLPCVSQGAAPLGREVTITAADGHVIHELAGRPALVTVERLISELSPRERSLVNGGLLLGIVVGPGKPEYEQGDFLVRGILGADPESGRIAVGASVQEGQVVRLHARDAKSADRDLTRALGVRVEAMAGRPPAGALVFSCNGRGEGMFGVPDHDAAALERELRGAPAAGFFAAGEIGPVGGRSFLHGFTATVAVFAG